LPKPLEHILYVEDEADIRTVAKMALEAVGGFSVLACSGGDEAITAAPTAGADLILLDVMMPGIDGPATLQALRNIPATAATPVIFMTAKVQAAEVAQYRTLGALDVIAKPFDPMQVSAEILRIWSAQPDEK
jgi:CheY-like chemotaxis protein